MANPIDLKTIVSRLQEAADRIGRSPAGLTSQATMTDLVVTAPGLDGAHGQGRTESIPFGVLFHDPVDRLSQAIDRIEAYCKDDPQFTRSEAA